MGSQWPIRCGVDEQSTHQLGTVKGQNGSARERLADERGSQDEEIFSSPSLESGLRQGKFTSNCMLPHKTELVEGTQ